MPRWIPKQTIDQIDLLLGLLVGLGLMFLVVTVTLELTGRTDEALIWALLLLADAIGVYLLVQARRRRMDNARRNESAR